MERLFFYVELILGAGIVFALVFLVKIWINGFTLALPIP